MHHALLYPDVDGVRGTKEESMGTFQNGMLFRKLGENLIENYFHFFHSSKE